jgi:hypothetical protein
MKQKVDHFLDLFPDFHSLDQTAQILALVYMYSVEEHHESINRNELENLFRFADTPVPKNLPQLLSYLSARGKKLINEEGEFSLQRHVRLALEEDIQLRRGIPTFSRDAVNSPFSFEKKSFGDRKIAALLEEIRKCYANDCWNACGLVMRIIVERTLDSLDSAVKAKNGLRDKINACRNLAALSKSVKEGLDNLLGAKILGDIAAHHSKILLDKNDIDIVLPVFRMLLKEVDTI